MKYTGTAPAVTDLEYFLGVLKAECDSVIPPLCGPEIVLTGYIAEDLSADDAASAEISDDTPGTGETAALPAGLAVVSSYEISRRYRGGHPRSYWPIGLPSDIGTDQTWSSAAVTAFQSAIAGVLDSLPASTSGGTTISSHVNVSYYSGFTSVENPITHRYRNVPTLRATPTVDLVTSVVVRPYIGSMRRRRNKTS